jgi:hypothetical protein
MECTQPVLQTIIDTLRTFFWERMTTQGGLLLASTFPRHRQFDIELEQPTSRIMTKSQIFLRFVERLSVQKTKCIGQSQRVACNQNGRVASS